MKKWELARYLIDAKKSVDTILYIAENTNEISHISLREKVNEAKRKFYIYCGDILDKSFPKQKKTICENPLIDAIYYERDKNNAHKDANYQAKQYASLDEMAKEMIQQLNEVKNVCSESLPIEVTLDYIPFDSELFRIAHGVTKDLEEKIFDKRHPSRKAHPIFPLETKEIPLFNDTEDLKNIPEDKRKEYGVLLQLGICVEESLQKLQDACIRINTLHDLNMWVTISKENLQRQKHLREIGLLDIFECPIIPSPDNQKEFAKFLKKLENEGLLKD